MKFTVDRYIFEDALFYLGKLVVKKKAIKPEYQSVHFRFFNNQFYLYSFNGHHFCEYHYGSVACPDGMFGVEYKLLDKIDPGKLSPDF